MPRRFSIVLLLVVPMACGGGVRTEAPPTTGASQAAPPGAQPGTLEEVPWAQKNHDQRVEYMAKVVAPKMTKVFQAFSPEAFAKVNCATCHGKNFKEVNFRMPNGLHPLSAADPIGSGNADSEETTKFMMETVVPTMAQLLGTQPISQDNPTGFGCFNCHDKQE